MTNDRQMAPAFAEVSGDQVALTITPAQLSTFVVLSARPPELVDLAHASASQWVEDAMFAIPARFPSEVALELARQLAPGSGGTRTDLRVAQMTLDDVFDRAGVSSPQRIASEVLAQRTRHRDEALQRQRAELASRAALVEEARTEARALVRAAEEKSVVDTERVQELEGRVNATQAELDWAKRKNTRLLISGGIFMVFVVMLFLSFRIEDGPGLATSIIGVAAFCQLVAAVLWLRNPKAKFRWVLIAAIVGVLGFLSAGLDLVDRFVTLVNPPSKP